MTNEEKLKIDPYGEEDWNDDPIPESIPITPTRILKFIIPVGNMTREQSDELVKKLVNSYKKDVEWE